MFSQHLYVYEVFTHNEKEKKYRVTHECYRLEAQSDDDSSVLLLPNTISSEWLFQRSESLSVKAQMEIELNYFLLHKISIFTASLK